MSFVRIPETCVGCNKAGSLLTIDYENSHARFSRDVVGSSRRHIIVANRSSVNSIKFPFKICPQC